MHLVARISQLAQLPAEGLDWIRSAATVQSFNKGEHLLMNGTVCSHLHFVRSGMLGGYYLSDGQEICNWMALEGEFATSYYSFISRQASFEYIVAFENTEVESISYEKINELYRLFPAAERAGRLILEEYYSRLEERMISLQFRSARERYETLCANRPQIIRRAPLGRIASYLGMKQETLSRIRAGKL